MNAQSRKWIVKAGKWFLLALPAAILGLGAIEISLRISRSRSFVTYQPCMHRGVGAAFLAYDPGCTSKQQTEHGEVTYNFNELGLRDRPAAVFAKGAIVALGDSITKGLYLDDGETIPALLERALKPELPFPILNAGVRYGNPTTESLLYRRLRSQFPIKMLIWFLNGTDTIDERFYWGMATATDENGIPTSFSPKNPKNPFRSGLLERLYQSARGHSFLLELIHQRINFQKYVALAESIPEDNQVLCGALFRLAADLKKDHVPFAMVFTPVPDAGINRIWPGMHFEMTELDKLVACARKTGAKILDLSHVAPNPAWYAGDRLHPSPAGARWIADQAAPVAAELIRQLR